MSLTRLLLFFIILHLLPVVPRIHLFFLFYHLLFSSILYYQYLLFHGTLNFTTHRHLLCRVTSGDIRLIREQCVLQICGNAIVPWPSVIFATSCAILTTRHGSSAGCTVVHVSLLCRAASVPKSIASLFADMKKWNMKKICRPLCSILMGSHYPNWSVPCRLASSVWPHVFHRAL